MVRKIFEDQIYDLMNDLLAMGEMVSQAIEHAMQALLAQDVMLAEQVIRADRTVNDTQHEIDEKCLVLIATQQPMASDLRSIVGVSNIAAEMERIGDYADGIAKLVLKLAGEPYLKPLVDLPRMAEQSRTMLHDVLQAFVHEDTEAAQRVAAADELVDELYDQVYRELLVFMMNDPKTITQATYLLWVGHNLERIADRTTNIAERVIFVASGQVVELNA